jgi:hypothetical protein
MRSRKSDSSGCKSEDDMIVRELNDVSPRNQGTN